MTLIYYQIIIKEKAQQKRGVFILIHYKINILEELKKKGYSSTRIHKEHLLSDQTVQSIREGKNISLATLNKICIMLKVQPGDLIEVVPTNDEILNQVALALGELAPVRRDEQHAGNHNFSPGLPVKSVIHM